MAWTGDLHDGGEELTHALASARRWGLYDGGGGWREKISQTRPDQIRRVKVLV